VGECGPHAAAVQPVGIWQVNEGTILARPQRCPHSTAAADADIGLGTVIDAHLAEAGSGPGDEGLVEGPGRRRRPRRRPERLAAPGGRAGLHRGTAAASGRTARGTARSAPRPSPGSQQLITLLAADPPVPDAEISARLGIPAGSIGPTRRRCLDKLRQHPAIAALTTAETPTAR
jgi:hypothetical protein